ncbi:MAG: hypothetical protein A2133_03525 [Actinobacteria bacterium RBG_16_64_13]|nr:MAG: hypothetical protein A2133_03525 [Actinobacteria bacterium RBG_16_64_13]
MPSSAPAGRAGKMVLAAVFLVLLVAVPFAVVAILPGTDEGGFTCRAEVRSRLAETLGGTLEFLMMSALEGEAPAEAFVATIDHGYTAGVEGGPQSAPADFPETAAGQKFWLQGSLMDKDTFFGEQYVFFGYPQLYVSQVKTGPFWPSQTDRLKTLYWSPVLSLGMVYWVWAFPFVEEYSLGAWLLVIARFLLVCSAAAAAVVWRKRRHRWTPGIIWVVGVYVLVAVLLYVPSL